MSGTSKTYAAITKGSGAPERKIYVDGTDTDVIVGEATPGSFARPATLDVDQARPLTRSGDDGASRRIR